MINALIRSFSVGALVSSRLLPLACVKWRVFIKQQLILTMFKRPGKGVTGFKKQTELLIRKANAERFRRFDDILSSL